MLGIKPRSLYARQIVLRSPSCQSFGAFNFFHFTHSSSFLVVCHHVMCISLMQCFREHLFCAYLLLCLLFAEVSAYNADIFKGLFISLLLNLCNAGSGRWLKGLEYRLCLQETRFNPWHMSLKHCQEPARSTKLGAVPKHFWV